MTGRDPTPMIARETPFVRRALRAASDPGASRLAVAYGPYREGQRPGGLEPTTAELREDLRLIAEHFDALRVYGATGPTERMLEIIRDDALELRVMLGIWIENDVPPDDPSAAPARAAMQRANRREIDTAIRLAGEYPGIVTWVSVGNETQVFWTGHPVPTERLIAIVREVRSAVRQPVAVADDFNFWNTPASRRLAEELDVIVTHIHPLWNGRTIDGAVDWTRSTYAEVRALHADREVVLGETGWATSKSNDGEQATLIVGTPGEAQQATFLDGIAAWVRTDGPLCFFFEAFDEPWKGGDHPAHVEKHWGLFRVDRTPKRALAHDR